MNVLYVMDLLGNGGVERMTLQWVERIAGDEITIDFVVRDVEIQSNKEFLLKRGCRIYTMPYTYEQLIQKKRVLNKVMKEKQYDIIHVHGAVGTDFPIFMWAKKAGIPVRIAHSHNAECAFRRWYAGMIHSITKKAIPIFATTFLGCSEDACKFYYGRVSNAIVIPNGIDTAIFRFCQTHREEMRKRYHTEDKIVYGSIGRCETQKNQEFLIEIYSEILKLQPNAKFLLVGHGSREQIIKKRVIELGLANHLIWIRQTADVDMYMSMMDVFILPSLYEGLGVVGIEAQSMGLPVLISEEAYHEEINLTRLLYKMKLKSGADRWAKKCIELSSESVIDRENYWRLIERAGYTIQSSADLLKKIYESELKRMKK